MTDIRRPRQSSSEHGGIGAKGQSRDHQLEETYRAWCEPMEARIVGPSLSATPIKRPVAGVQRSP
ncbi:hypothetical protein [Paraburkholderia aspalathi]|uniref:hypothetical protein n=1 Tax=Paraburkholderia aspalathi TaxID=1324617 RepID=UPI00116099F5|nr:hypothetical protein [Paraburkholderia aspalathi]